MKAHGPGQSALLLLDVIAVLEAAGFDYAVVGAMAARTIQLPLYCWFKTSLKTGSIC